MNNHQDIMGLSDEQLIEKVAVEVMGWARIPMEFGKMKWCLPPSVQERMLPEHRVPVILSVAWNPLTDWNHTMELVKRMRKPVTIEIHEGACRVFRGADLSIFDTNQQRAICLAALHAVSSQA